MGMAWTAVGVDMLMFVGVIYCPCGLGHDKTVNVIIGQMTWYTDKKAGAIVHECQAKIDVFYGFFVDDERDVVFVKINR